MYRYQQQRPIICVKTHTFSFYVKYIWVIVFKTLIYMYIPIAGVVLGVYLLIKEFPFELIAVNFEYNAKSNPNFWETFYYMEAFTSIIVSSWLLALHKQLLVILKIVIVHPVYALWLTLIITLPKMRIGNYTRVEDIPECLQLTTNPFWVCSGYHPLMIKINGTDVNCCKKVDRYFEMHLIVQLLTMYFICIAFIIAFTKVVFKSELKEIDNYKNNN